jgi:hypothetical protein
MNLAPCFCGENVVEQYLCCCEAGGACADFTGVVDEITAHGESRTLHLLLLGTNSNDNASVRYFAVFWDIGVRNEEYSASALVGLRNALLCKPSELVGKRVRPFLLGIFVSDA